MKNFREQRLSFWMGSRKAAKAVELVLRSLGNMMSVNSDAPHQPTDRRGLDDNLGARRCLHPIGVYFAAVNSSFIVGKTVRSNLSQTVHIRAFVLTVTGRRLMLTVMNTSSDTKVSQ